jgi:Flp pilus assembly pilin Flp
MKLIHNTRKAKRGAALVEYGLIVAGVALVAAVAVSVFGSKTAGMIAASAHVLPGTNQDDNGPIGVGHVVKTTGGNGALITADANELGNTSMGDALGVDSDTWVQDP